MCMYMLELCVKCMHLTRAIVQLVKYIESYW